jgi:hypothetical protein
LESEAESRFKEALRSPSSCPRSVASERASHWPGQMLIWTTCDSPGYIGPDDSNGGVSRSDLAVARARSLSEVAYRSTTSRAPRIESRNGRNAATSPAISGVEGRAIAGARVYATPRATHLVLLRGWRPQESGLRRRAAGDLEVTSARAARQLAASRTSRDRECARPPRRARRGRVSCPEATSPPINAWLSSHSRVNRGLLPW